MTDRSTGPSIDRAPGRSPCRGSAGGGVSLMFLAALFCLLAARPARTAGDRIPLTEERRAVCRIVVAESGRNPLLSRGANLIAGTVLRWSGVGLPVETLEPGQ